MISVVLCTHDDYRNKEDEDIQSHNSIFPQNVQTLGHGEETVENGLCF